MRTRTLAVAMLMVGALSGCSVLNHVRLMNDRETAMYSTDCNGDTQAKIAYLTKQLNTRNEYVMQVIRYRADRVGVEDSEQKEAMIDRAYNAALRDLIWQLRASCLSN